MNLDVLNFPDDLLRVSPIPTYRLRLSDISEIGKQQRITNKDPDFWKVYQRLKEGSNRKFLEEIRKHNKKCPDFSEQEKTLPSTVLIPQTQAYCCSCYHDAMQLIRDICRQTPQGPRTAKGRNQGSNNSYLKKIRQDFENNNRMQLPLSTVTVRWQFKKSIPGYDLLSLAFILSKYGNIKDIRKLSPNSALVIYEDIVGACQAMQAKHLGEPYNKIHCSWWHRSMERKSFYPSSRGISVKTNSNLPCFENRTSAVAPQLVRVKNTSILHPVDRKTPVDNKLPSLLHAPLPRTHSKNVYISQLGIKKDLLTPNEKHDSRSVRFQEADEPPLSGTSTFRSAKSAPPNSVVDSTGDTWQKQ